MDIKNIYTKFGQRIVPGTDYDGRFAWFSTCYECGTRTKTTLHMKNSKIYCDRCKNELLRQKREAKAIEDDSKYEKRFEQGVALLEKKVRNAERFRPAIAKARTKIRRYGSTDEVLAAIVMFHFGYDFQMQQKIGRYRADFLLPKEKLIVEVDGKPFHSDKRKEQERDNEMSIQMGQGWKTLHIPTELLRRKPLALNDAIKKWVS